MRHDKRYEELDTLDDYKLEDSSQDIRGRPLVGPEGRSYGIIQDLLVSEGRDHVAAIRLDNGKVCAIEPLVIHENAVVYGEEAERFADAGGDAVSEERVPVIEEQVVIGKRLVENGRRITVSSHVETDRVAEDVRLREENVTIEKRPVNREVSSADAEALLEGREVSMTERSEEVVVGKKAVVTDEVVISKNAGDRVERVEETVRRTEVDVDVDGGKNRR